MPWTLVRNGYAFTQCSDIIIASKLSYYTGLIKDEWYLQTVSNINKLRFMNKPAKMMYRRAANPVRYTIQS